MQDVMLNAIYKKDSAQFHRLYAAEEARRRREDLELLEAAVLSKDQGIMAELFAKAVLNSDIESIRDLTDGGADVDKASEGNEAPLHVGIMNIEKSLNAIKELLRNGADTNIEESAAHSREFIRESAAQDLLLNHIRSGIFTLA